MSNFTTKQRINFVEDVATVLSEMEARLYSSFEDLNKAARNINISSVLNVSNVYIDRLAKFSENKAVILKACDGVLEVYADNKDNVGQYKVLVDSCMDAVAKAKKSPELPKKQDVNSDGAENTAPEAFKALSEALHSIRTVTSSGVKKLSACAGNLKADKDSKIAITIGRNLETVTNTWINSFIDVDDQVKQIAKDYNVELCSVADVAKVAQNVEGFKKDRELRDFSC